MDGARDKVWFITGCSTGMGRDIALAALARGYRVVLTARNPDTVADIHARCRERSAVARLDVTDRAQIGSAVAHAQQGFGRIDGLVNNPGYGYLSPVQRGHEAE